jgi:hypothetical protein
VAAGGAKRLIGHGLAPALGSGVASAVTRKLWRSARISKLCAALLLSSGPLARSSATPCERGGATRPNRGYAWYRRNRSQLHAKAQAARVWRLGVASLSSRDVRAPIWAIRSAYSSVRSLGQFNLRLWVGRIGLGREQSVQHLSGSRSAIPAAHGGRVGLAAPAGGRRDRARDALFVARSSGRRAHGAGDGVVSPAGDSPGDHPSPVSVSVDGAWILSRERSSQHTPRP